MLKIFLIFVVVFVLLYSILYVILKYKNFKLLKRAQQNYISILEAELDLTSKIAITYGYKRSQDLIDTYDKHKIVITKLTTDL